MRIERHLASLLADASSRTSCTKKRALAHFGHDVQSRRQAHAEDYTRIARTCSRLRLGNAMRQEGPHRRGSDPGTRELHYSREWVE